jgi:hypothetical protein
MKFAHLADSHLGGWRQEELRNLNFQSFQWAVKKIIKEKLDFVLIAGDLFDSAYPPIEILKETFAEFKKISDARIPVYIIAGSHDFSASGKTFLDVLEKAGFCKNIEKYNIRESGEIILEPTHHEDIALFGYSGKKSSLEVQDLKKVKFSNIFPINIFMLHTTLKDVVGNIPMEYITKEELPLANYYALGHIHQRVLIQEKGAVFSYPGPLYPNNFQELVDLKQGSFNIVELNNGKINIENIKIPSLEIVYIEKRIENAFNATEEIIQEMDKRNLKDKLVLLKLTGVLKQGKTGDINFNIIQDFAMKKECYIFLRNISSLEVQELDISIKNEENVEEKILEDYVQKNPDEFNKFLPQLMNIFSLEKKEDEKSVIFEDRLIDELKQILDLKEVIR